MEEKNKKKTAPGIRNDEDTAVPLRADAWNVSWKVEYSVGI